MQPRGNFIIGQLWDGHEVKLDPGTFGWGGSWSGATPENPIAYDPGLLEFAYDILMRMQNPFLVDVGANTGSFSLLPVFVPGLKCLAFEPRLHEILRRNVVFNTLEARVAIQPLAVSDHFHGGHLWYSPQNIQSGRATLKEVDGWKDVFVRTTTLNLSAPDETTLVKIDVEGAEPEVLRGAEVFLRRVAPALIVEWRHAGMPATAGFLRGLGYQIKDLGNHRDFYAWRKDEHAAA